MKIGNWPLLLLAIEHIIKHPSEYDQTSWYEECGSLRCVAGWIAFFAGYRDVVRRGGTRFEGVRLDSAPDSECPLQVEDAALAALELDPELYDEGSDERNEFADSLFGGALSLSDILTTVRDLAKADGVTPTPLIIEEMTRYGIISEWDVF
jgi:hypothetical protein